ncbi:hypothetical protein [Herpetosiphon giganteus]|uniref:hypothetical protein n=1 Tax=Herpetosiphon giganteus TaxID=2029754 RepID=UPI001956A6EC|nr:hypothetical protein [Herpetosiphon giganteus]MBM7845625.1 hypothetical protein [Herpetosiphon giganteus]
MSIQSFSKIKTLTLKIIDELGKDFSIDSIRCFIEQIRNKPLLIQRATIPNSINGFVVGLADVDLIVIAANVDDVLVKAICTHEMGHLLAGHIPLVSFGSDTPSLDNFNLEDFAKIVLYRDNRYESRQEQEAEYIGRFLLAADYRYESTIPPHVRHMFR